MLLESNPSDSSMVSVFHDVPAHSPRSQRHSKFHPQLDQRSHLVIHQSKFHKPQRRGRTPRGPLRWAFAGLRRQRFHKVHDLGRRRDNDVPLYPGRQLLQSFQANLHAKFRCPTSPLPLDYPVTMSNREILEKARACRFRGEITSEGCRCKWICLSNSRPAESAPIRQTEKGAEVSINECFRCQLAGGPRE